MEEKAEPGGRSRAGFDDPLVKEAFSDVRSLRRRIDAAPARGVITGSCG